MIFRFSLFLVNYFLNSLALCDTSFALTVMASGSIGVVCYIHQVNVYEASKLIMEHIIS